MVQYNDQKWLSDPEHKPITIAEGEVVLLRQEVDVLNREVASLIREMSALVEIISETCREGEKNRQPMPPRLAAWWSKHR